MTVGRPAATARVQRVLELVPWVAARDGPTRAEICEHFGINDEQLSADLGVVWFVGLPPYTPDSLIDVVQEDDRVWIRYPEVFERPQRMTPEQGLALLAAGASVLALPGSDAEGPLASGVAKLASVLGVSGGTALEIDLGRGRPEVVATLRQAIAEHRQVRLDHYTFNRDERTSRVVDPHRLHADRGALYLLAHCHLVGGERWFRVDRIHHLDLLDDTFEEPADAAVPEVFSPGSDDPRLTLDLQPAAAWVVEHYPVEAVEERPEGAIRVTLAVSAVPWLERLLLTLGPDARVVAGPEDLMDVGRSAGARVLGRYTLHGQRRRPPLAPLSSVTEVNEETDAEGQAAAGEEIEERDERDERKEQARVRSIVEWVAVIVGALIIALVIKTFLFQAFYIPSESMLPTLEKGDRVLVNKLSYDLHDVNRGDVVVFERPPNQPETEIKDLIKRVIGLPGDVIEARDGTVFIDDKPLDEPYLAADVVTENLPKQTIPEDHVFVMGDNRGASQDSRVFGAIEEDLIVGRAFVRIWPVTHLGGL